MGRLLALFAIGLSILSEVVAENEVEKAIIPYRIFFEFANLKPGSDYEEEYRSVAFRMSSQLDGVDVEEIEIYIDSEAGKVPLELNSDGIFDVPISLALYEENPDIISNQPKGSLYLKLAMGLGGRAPFELPQDGSPRMRYLSLFPLDEIRQGINEFTSSYGSGEVFSDETRDRVCVIFENATHPDSGRITIEGEGTDTRLPKDEEGRFLLPFDPQLAEINPWVRFDPQDGWSCRVVILGAEEEANEVSTDEMSSVSGEDSSAESLSGAQDSERFQEVLREHPENFGVRAKYALWLMSQGEYENALAEFEKADEISMGIRNFDETVGFPYEKFYAQTLYGAAVERINREGVNVVSLRRIQLALGMGKDSLRDLGSLQGCYAVLSVLYQAQGQFDLAIEAANLSIETAIETGHVEELPTLKLQLKKAEAAAKQNGQ